MSNFLIIFSTKKLSKVKLLNGSIIGIEEMKLIKGGSLNLCAPDERKFYCKIMLEGGAGTINGYICAGTADDAVFKGCQVHAHGFRCIGTCS